MARDSAQSLRAREGSGRKKGVPGMLTQADAHQGVRVPRGESPLPIKAHREGDPRRRGPMSIQDRSRWSLPCTQPASLSLCPVCSSTDPHTQKQNRSLGDSYPHPNLPQYISKMRHFIRKSAYMQTDTEIHSNC